MQLYGYVVWLSFFTLFAEVISSEGKTLFYSSPYPINSSAEATHVISFIGTLFGWWHFTWREVKQYREEEVTVHTESKLFTEHKFWNYLQRINYGIVFVALVLDLIILRSNAESDELLDLLRSVTAVCAILMWIGSLHYMRGFEYTAHIIRMFSQIITDFLPFFLIVFIQVVGFAICFRLIYSGYAQDLQTCELISEDGDIGICDEVETGYDSFLRALYTAYLTGFLG